MRKKNGKYLIQDTIRLIDEFLNEEIDLSDVKKWLETDPCNKNNHCGAKEKAILAQLKNLTQKPINNNEWQEFQNQLKDSDQRRKVNK